VSYMGHFDVCNHFSGGGFVVGLDGDKQFRDVLGLHIINCLSA